MANSDSSTAREARLAQHLRNQLQHRHASNPRFLEILFRLTDAMKQAVRRDRSRRGVKR
jgi:hypothetical protein